MTILSFSLTFGRLVVLHGVLDSNFKFYDFCCQWTHQGGDWETKWSVSWFDCDESLTWQGLDSNSGHFGSFNFIFVSCGESRLLVSCCAGGRCSMACSDEDRGRSRRPDTKYRGRSHRSGTRWPHDREVGWRRVWSTPCTWRRGARVSWLSLKTKVDGFSVVCSQNHWDGFLRFGLKTGGDGFLRFGLKTIGSRFPVWALKPAVTVWWFEP
jgi:hypothetical protein